MRFCLFIFVFFHFSGFAQTKIQGTEIGFDGYVSISNQVGNIGVGVKYGFNLSDNFIIGPSIRYQRLWINNFGEQYSHNIYGGGIFAHYRFLDYFFVGTEIEFFKTRINFYNYYSPTRVVPTVFVGGGFSYAWENFRLNAGIFYDLVDDMYSPFRITYQVKKANGVIVPLIYRIGIFIPLT